MIWKWFPGSAIDSPATLHPVVQGKGSFLHPLFYLIIFKGTGFFKSQIYVTSGKHYFQLVIQASIGFHNTPAKKNKTQPTTDNNV